MAAAELDIVIKAKDDASKALDKLGGKLGELGSAAAGAAKFLGASMLAAGAAAAAFSAKAIGEYSEVGDAIEKMSTKTGISAESISALRVAADGAGTTVETVVGAIQKMSLGMDESTGKASKVSERMADLGVVLSRNFEDKDQSEKFVELGNAIGAMTDPAERTRAAVAAFGKSGSDLIPLFEGGAFSMAEWSAKAKELGVSFDDVSARKASDLNDAIGEMKSAFQGITLEVGGALAPAFTAFAQNAMPVVAELARWVGDRLPAALETLGSWFNAAIETGTRFYRFLDDTGVIDAFRSAFQAVWNTIQTQLIPAFAKLQGTVAAHWDQLKPFAEFLGAVVVVSFLAVLGAVNLVIAATSKMIEWTAASITAWVNFKANVLQVWDEVKAKVQSTVDFIRQLVASAIAEWNRMVATVSAPVKTASTAWSNLPANLGFRANGGTVSGGAPYVVGERGPELFVPSTGGNVMPSGSFGGGMVVNVTGNTIASDMDLRDVAEKVGDAIIEKLGMNRRLTTG